MTWCGTKAMLIHFIYGKCHIKQMKSRKSCKTCLINYSWSISHHIMPLVINVLGGRRTQTHITAHEPKQIQVRRLVKIKLLAILKKNSMLGAFTQRALLCISGKTDCIIS